MINLLPPELRDSLVFARKNTEQRKYTLYLFIVIILLITTVMGGLGILNKSSNDLNKIAEDNRSLLKLQNQESIQKEVEDLSGSLNLVVQVLSKEILFSKLLKQVGSVMPHGSILTSLSIDKVAGGLDLQARATDYQTASQVQVNLQDPKSILFEKVDIVNVQCENTASGDPVASKYPCTIQLRALFSKTNPFTFINTQKASQ